MKYIINLNLVFDSDSRVLVLKNDINLSVGLSKPATRLLSELIINNNTTLISDEIIKNVWVDYGFTASKASLSNHISELRKAFDSLGIDKEIIITVPRTGFRMEAEIHPVAKHHEPIEKVSADDSSNTAIDETSLLVNEHVVPQSENRPEAEKKITRMKNVGILACGLCLLTVALWVVFFFMSDKDNVRLVSTNEKCNIYSFKNTKPPSHFIENATKMLDTEGINCSEKSADIYYTDARQDSDLLRVSFMAVCYKSADSHYQQCINYKLVK